MLMKKEQFWTGKKKKNTFLTVHQSDNEMSFLLGKAATVP